MMEAHEFGNNGDPQSLSRFHHERPQSHSSISHKHPSPWPEAHLQRKILVDEMMLWASKITNGSKMMLMASQGSHQRVSQLGAVAQKYQAATQNASSSITVLEMQSYCNMFVASARQLAKTLEVPLVNDLGYTKRYVRCLQCFVVDLVSKWMGESE